jgi:hypothetical protein
MNFFGSSVLASLFSNPVQAITVILALVVAITIHEFAHAWTADRLGDDTPRLQGRVTLSPLAHLDPMGSIMMLLVGFGWGKPVIYNPMRLSRKSDELLIALAGPISNLLLATLLNVIAFFSLKFGFHLFSSDVLVTVAGINILLASYFLPEYRSLVGGQIGLVILLLLIFSGALGPIIQFIQIGFAHVTLLFGLLG